MHFHTAWAQWAVELMQCTAPPLGGNGQWASCYALPHSSGAVGKVQFLKYTAGLSGGCGQCNSCYAQPRC